MEEKLIEKCKNGDLQSFRELLGSASPFAFSVAFRVLADEEAAKDTVQDAMVSMWQNINKIRSAGSFKTWLYRIVINKCYDHLRKRKKEQEIRPDEKTWQLISNHLSEQPVNELENEEMGRLINFMIATLSPRQKAVFVLSEIEELPADEISEITGMNKSLVKANLYHARRHITGMIAKYL